MHLVGGGCDENGAPPVLGWPYRDARELTGVGASSGAEGGGACLPDSEEVQRGLRRLVSSDWGAKQWSLTISGQRPVVSEFSGFYIVVVFFRVCCTDAVRVRNSAIPVCKTLVGRWPFFSRL